MFIEPANAINLHLRPLFSTTQTEVTSMTLKLFGFSLFSLVLGIAFFAATAPVNSLNIQDDRAADREAIRAHIDSIFQAFIKKDAAALRATHAENWLGYLEGSRTMIKGVGGYMEWNQVDPKSPYGIKNFQIPQFRHKFKKQSALFFFLPRLPVH